MKNKKFQISTSISTIAIQNKPNVDTSYHINPNQLKEGHSTLHLYDSLLLYRAMSRLGEWGRWRMKLSGTTQNSYLWNSTGVEISRWSSGDRKAEMLSSINLICARNNSTCLHPAKVIPTRCNLLALTVIMFYRKFKHS